jgi:hypothetical protein
LAGKNSQQKQEYDALFCMRLLVPCELPKKKLSHRVKEDGGYRDFAVTTGSQTSMVCLTGHGDRIPHQGLCFQTLDQALIIFFGMTQLWPPRSPSF